MLHPTRHPSTISNWERGKRVPRQASLAQLADLFDWGTGGVEAVAAAYPTASVDGHLIARDAVRTANASAADPGQRLSRLEALLSGLRAIYDEAFEDGHVAAYGEAQKEILLLRKQLASERDRAVRQQNQLVELQRRAEMRRLAEQSQ